MAITTWNPSDKHADITLSNGDLTALAGGTSGWDNVRSTVGKSSGKWYWEITYDVEGSSGHTVKVCAGTSDVALDVDIFLDSHAYGYYAGSGNKSCAADGGAGGVPYGFESAYIDGDIIGVALDMDNGKIWFSKNGVWRASGDPAAGTDPACTGLSGTIYAMWCEYLYNGQITANFGASPFAYSIPSGFSGFDGDEVAEEADSATFYPAANSDDGVRSGDTDFVVDGTSMLLGKDGDVPQYNFIRFTDVTIPQGSRIVLAQLKVTAAATASTETVILGHRFVDADNPTAPTTYQEFDDLELTSASNSSLDVPSWIDGEQRTLPVYSGAYFDLKNQLQEVVNRTGFSSGNAVILHCSGYSSDNIGYTWEEVAPKLVQTIIYNLIVFGDEIYGSGYPGGRLYKWNGVDAWTEVAGYLPTNIWIYSLVEFNGKIYGSGLNGNLLEWNGVDAWVEVAASLPLPTGLGISGETIRALIEFGGKIYGGTRASSFVAAGVGRLLEWNGVDAWTEIIPYKFYGAEKQICSLATVNNRLYAGTGQSGKLYEWNGSDDWNIVAPVPSGSGVFLWSIAIFNNRLYAGKSNGQLLRWNGMDDWEEVSQPIGCVIGTHGLAELDGELYGCMRLFGCSGTPVSSLYKWNGSDAWIDVCQAYDTEEWITDIVALDGTIYGAVSDVHADTEHVGCLFKMVEGDSANRSISTYDYNSGSEKPELYVIWAGKGSAGDWVSVAPQLGSETDIYTTTELNGSIYSGTSSGALLEWNGVDAWVEVAPPFGAETTISSTIEYNGSIYGGTSPGGMLLEWNGTDAWVEAAPSIGETNIPCLVEFDGSLYGGSSPNGYLLEWNGVDEWVNVTVNNGAGVDATEVCDLIVFNNTLYGATSPNAQLLEWNGIDAWELAADTPGIETAITSLVVYDGNLYGGSFPSGILYVWDEVDTWVEVAPQLGAESISSLVVYNDTIYGATEPGGLIYEWNGVDAWLLVSSDSVADSIYSLIVFDDAIYGGSGGTGELFVWDEIPLINANVSIPMAEASGLTGAIGTAEIPMPEALAGTGIYSSISTPMTTAELNSGATAIDTIPMTTVEGFTGITSTPSIPMVRVGLTSSDGLAHIKATVTLPIATASLTQTAGIKAAVTVPAMTASITEREASVIDVTIPMMTAELSAGIHANVACAVSMMTASGLFSNQCEVAVPMVTAALIGTVGRVITSNITIPMATADGLFGGQCESTIPMMTAEMEGKVGRVISSNVSVPMMTASIIGKTGHLGDIAVSIPMMLVYAELMTGTVIAGNVVIPMITASLSSYEEITGCNIAVTVPMLEAYMIGTTERAACPVLRYDDKPDILGSIAVLNPIIEVSIT